MIQSATSRGTKYLSTPEIDALIGEAYRKQRQGDRRALKSLSARIGWPASVVSRRGVELGLSRVKEQPWSAREEEILLQFGHLTRGGIQRKLAQAGFQRSCAAIAVKTTRMRIKSNLDGYSANSLAIGFGVDVHRVLTWIRRGLLRAERRQTQRTPAQGGDTWWIEDTRVKQFIMRYPEEIDLARVEKFWFLDLITDGKVCR